MASHHHPHKLHHSREGFNRGRPNSGHQPALLVQGASPSRLAGSREPTLALGGLEHCGEVGPTASRGGGCRGFLCSCPRGRAHLCQRHTRSGRCGDTPSGSSPRWLPLAGSSSTSLNTPGNSEQGRRDVERQRDPRQSPAQEQSTPTAPTTRGTRRRPCASPAPCCLPRAASFLLCRRTPGDAVPLARPSAATHNIPTRRTAPLDGTELAAILHGAGGAEVKGHGLGRAVARWQWCWRTAVFPISCPVPSGCCRDGNTRLRGVGRQQPPDRRAASTHAWEYGQPQTWYREACWRPPARRLPGGCPLPLPSAKSPVSPWQSPSSALPILLARCARAPLALGEEQGRAVPSLQLPFPCCPSLWRQATSRPFLSPILPSPGCLCPVPSRPLRRTAGLGDATHRAQHPHGPGPGGACRPPKT